MADEADVKLIRSHPASRSLLFDDELVKATSFHNVTLPSEANLELVFSILPPRDDVRLSNIELVKVNTGIYNADFPIRISGILKRMARENSAALPKGYYMTLYPMMEKHNEVKASQYVTG